MGGTFHYIFTQTCGLHSTKRDHLVKHGRWVVGTCQYRLTTCNRCTTSANQMGRATKQRTDYPTLKTVWPLLWSAHLANCMHTLWPWALPCHAADAALCSQSPGVCFLCVSQCGVSFLQSLWRYSSAKEAGLHLNSSFGLVPSWLQPSLEADSAQDLALWKQNIRSDGLFHLECFFSESTNSVVEGKDPATMSQVMDRRNWGTWGWVLTVLTACSLISTFSPGHLWLLISMA